MDAVERLRTRLGVLSGLGHAGGLISWDQATMMPPGSAAGQARAMGAVSRVAHEMATGSEFGHLLEAAEQEVAATGLPAESDTARLLWVTRYDFDRARRLPTDFVAEWRQTTMLANQCWQTARGRDDFAILIPHLEQVIGLARQMADYLGYDEHPYDALLDRFEPGTRLAGLRPLFDKLRTRIVPLVRAIGEAGPLVDDALLHQPYEVAAQWALARELAVAFGYDLERGRIDEAAHPFCSTLSRNDVRMTIRADPTLFNPCFFATAHESGHALYGQGTPAAFEESPLAAGASAAVHESQSRLWENMVGRSRPFLHHFFPTIQRHFPEQLGTHSAESFYRAVNLVAPTINRVEADEVTYNLHIMLRFELEVALLEGSLQVADLPTRWRDGMEEMLGVVPPDDRDGVMQDMHWATGLIGYFPTYTLGNLMAAQLYEAACAATPEIPAQIGAGNTAPLLDWMRQEIHAHGRKFLPEPLIERASGRPLSPEPFLAYLEGKFGELYGLK